MVVFGPGSAGRQHPATPHRTVPAVPGDDIGQHSTGCLQILSAVQRTGFGDQLAADPSAGLDRLPAPFR